MLSNPCIEPYSRFKAIPVLLILNQHRIRTYSSHAYAKQQQWLFND
ncbi:hypothetical protein BMETH_3210_0 [methanotrophic bacterial endosymbiont of Bathymodiolus sp.]|nr:hypothetical protein BMETH_3210_0 [methanotrophic bacterial endosymbiont of Bathymodiolus sp.]